MPRAVLLTAVLAVLSGPVVSTGASGTPPSTPTASPPAAVVQYAAPVAGRVLRPFVPPPTPYAAGHRGVDLAAGPGAPVAAAAAGTVRFAGPVAGRGVVVLVHPDGIATEYEPVRPLVRAGQAVGPGQVVGRIAGRHAGCPSSCLHWGARRGGTYLDPLSLLRPLGPVVLLPWATGAGGAG
jgi:murein DD-endopeptidase MepM/ murein hydrolase activator NlpD